MKIIKSKILRKITKHGCVLVFCFLFCVTPAFAGNSNTSEWNAYMNSAARILQTLALTGGAVGIAFCGMEYALGSDQTASKAISKAFIIFAAVAALFMLPSVVRLGISVVSNLKWDPSSLK